MTVIMIFLNKGFLHFFHEENPQIAQFLNHRYACFQPHMLDYIFMAWKQTILACSKKVQQLKCVCFH